jgi:hypothetical protein
LGFLRIVFDREIVDGGKTKKLRLLVADGDYSSPLHQPRDASVGAADLDSFSADYRINAKHPSHWV